MLSEIFNPLSIFLHVINALILFFAIKYLLYKPVRKFLQKREDAVAKELDEAKDAKAQADKMLEESRQQQLDAKAQANEAISQSAQRAQDRAQEILENAKLQAGEILGKAEEEAERIRKQAREAMAEEAANLAVSIASKVLEREVTLQDNKKIIEEYLEKVG